MNKHIDHLRKQDAMMSSSLKETLKSSDNQPVNSLSEKTSALIELGSTTIELTSVQSFHYDSISCEISCQVGQLTLEKIQSIINEKCLVTFYNLKEQFKLMSYHINQVSAPQMILTLRFVTC